MTGKRTSFTYYPGMLAVPAGSVPNVLNKSFSITADVTTAAGKNEGAIFSLGGGDGGYGLYVRDNRPVFVGNFLGRTVTRVASRAPLPSGAVKLRGEFRYDGGGMGKGGTMTLLVNGQKVARAASNKPKGLPWGWAVRSISARTRVRRSMTLTLRRSASTGRFSK